MGSAFYRTGSRQALIVNNSATAVSLNMADVFRGAVRWEQWSASLATRVTGPGDVAVTTGRTSGRVSLQPHAVIRIYQ